MANAYGLVVAAVRGMSSGSRLRNRPIDRVVHARPELHDAERHQRSPPFHCSLVYVGVPGCAPVEFHLAVGLILDVLHECAGLVSDEAVAAAFAEGNVHAAGRSMPRGDQARPGD